MSRNTDYCWFPFRDDSRYHYFRSNQYGQMAALSWTVRWSLLERSSRVKVILNSATRLFSNTTMANSLVCKIGPSVLNADLSRLHEESEKMLHNGADYIHLDVMDGHFVPNITFGHPVVKCLRNKIKSAFFETHMMVSKPEQWILPMADAGVNQYTFHVEATDDVPDVCRKVKEAGMLVGLGIKPKTDVKVVAEFIDNDLCDMILIMTVEPGFGGQTFMSDMMSKVKWLRENYPSLDVEVDGGVGPSTIGQCAEAGANMIVSGSAVTGASNQQEVISSLRSAVETVLKCNKST